LIDLNIDLGLFSYFGGVDFVLNFQSKKFNISIVERNNWTDYDLWKLALFFDKNPSSNFKYNIKNLDKQVYIDALERTDNNLTKKL